MWFVRGIQTKTNLSVFGEIIEISLIFGDGMVGVIPVFDTKESAENYSAGRFPVEEVITEEVLAKA